MRKFLSSLFNCQNHPESVPFLKKPFIIDIYWMDNQQGIKPRLQWVLPDRMKPQQLTINNQVEHYYCIQNDLASLREINLAQRATDKIDFILFDIDVSLDEEALQTVLQDIPKWIRDINFFSKGGNHLIYIVAIQFTSLSSAHQERMMKLIEEKLPKFQQEDETHHYVNEYVLQQVDLGTIEDLTALFKQAIQKRLNLPLIHKAFLSACSP